jgi:hypothetical protein
LLVGLVVIDAEFGRRITVRFSVTAIGGLKPPDVKFDPRIGLNGWLKPKKIWSYLNFVLSFAHLFGLKRNLRRKKIKVILSSAMLL